MVSGNSEAKEMDMSKYMQLKVTVSPCYAGDLEKVYPKLARHMGYLDANLVRQNPSLFELAGQLDQLLYRFEGTQLRTVLLQHGEKLRKLHKGIVRAHRQLESGRGGSDALRNGRSLRGHRIRPGLGFDLPVFSLTSRAFGAFLCKARHALRAVHQKNAGAHQDQALR